ncbi:TetR/AcrR family transcriptional regulator [Tellurirhabdus rosea]|uniref:TetR/AcrR family transcriptional regulator n=1 Tax=Tellurirhabdus rosea TaxID=2674997 RepID=UPI00225B83C6|nr:TetR/AcrR family transcriptional regulator [Tellurirhabdus rosea]
MKERILAEARHQFYHFGVKTVRLDDIAQQLGISKKTLYQYFSSKEELVRAMLEAQLNEAMTVDTSIHAQVVNPIVAAMQLWDRLSGYRQTTNPNLLRDIQRFYPTVWAMFQAFRTAYINTILATNLRQGVEQELYRRDLNENVLAWLWAEESQWDIPFSEADAAIKHHFIRGLLTPKGLALYETLLP